MKTAEGCRLSYLKPESSDPGMTSQLLGLDDDRFPFRSSRFTIEPGGASPPDNHSVAEMWIVIEGAGDLRYESQSVAIETGDVFYFEPFQTHEVRNHSDSSLKILSFWWHAKCST
jgi:mannose-6-phosphate isomerase-like protein (cupin superfamily)